MRSKSPSPKHHKPTAAKPDRKPLAHQVQSAMSGCACGGDCPKCAAGPVSSSIEQGIGARRGKGHGLPVASMGQMEKNFGRSFADVRIHTDPGSAILAREVGARAFTTGSDIFFGRNQFNPGSTSGQKLIAHELAHVDQQGPGDLSVRRFPVCQKEGQCYELDDLSNEELMSINPFFIVDEDLQILQDEIQRRRREFEKAGYTDPQDQDLVEAYVLVGEEIIRRRQAKEALEPKEPEDTGPRSGFNLETGEFIRLDDLPPLEDVDGFVDPQLPESVPEPAPAPEPKSAAKPPTSKPKSKPKTPPPSPTLASIAAARAGVSLTITGEREVMFPNPKILGVFPVKRGGGPRRELFDKLIKLGHKRIKLEEKTIPELEKALAKAIKARDKQKARVDKHAPRPPKGSPPDPAHAGKKLVHPRTFAKLERQLGNKEAAVILAEEELRRAKEKIPELIKEIEAEAKAIEPKVRAELTTRRDAAQLELDAAQAKINKIQAEIDKLDPTNKKHKRKIKAKKKALRKPEKAKAKALAKRDKYAGALKVMDSEALVITQRQQAFKISVTRGSGTLKTSLKPVGPGANVDRPFGFVGGGAAEISDKVIEEALSDMFTDPKQVQNAIRVLATFKANEGRADSINTWDRARLTLGPGLAAFGVLQKVLKSLKQHDPDVFHELIGQYGIDITMAKHPKIEVIVPPASAALPADVLLDPTSPFKTPPKPGDRLTETDSLEYIVRDPVLLAVLRLAGQHEAMQRAMVRLTAGSSLKKAMGFTLKFTKVKWTKPDKTTEKKNFNITWEDIINRITTDPADYLDATRAALADEAHGTGNTGNAEKVAKKKYLELMRAKGDVDPADYTLLTEDEIIELAKTVAAIVPHRRRSVFRREFGTIGEDLFPAKAKKKKVKKE